MRTLPNAESVADQVLAASDHRGPPTDLTAVCSLWPQLSVTEEALEQAGYLISLGVHGAEVLLRKNDPQVRKHYTLAHELGHWVLANLEADRVRFGRVPTPNVPFVVDHKRSTPEETWCNRFASCLLMPTIDVHQYLGDFASQNVAEKISVGHTTFQVSQEAFLSRVPRITPVSVFEIVTFDGKMRVRRKFLCDRNFGQKADLLVNELLRKADPANFGLRKKHKSTDYQIEAVLTRDSSNARSWLVTVIPENVTPTIVG